VRILFLTQWFAPEPHFKGLPFALELQRRGHEVIVLTGFPNYPGGRLYPGYRLRLWQRETISGVPVVRVALYPSHSKSAVGRALNYLSFALSAALLGPFLVGPADVAYVYHPPATIGLPALCWRWLWRVPSVYDVQDLWPDTLAATGMLRSALLLSVIGVWSNFVYRRMEHVVVLSPGFRDSLIRRGVHPRCISVIYNWSPDAGSSGDAPLLSKEEGCLLGGRFNVLFAGNMGPAQALESVLMAAKLAYETAPEIQFVFVGGGVALGELKAYARAEGIKNVVFLPRRSAAEMPALYSVSDALLVHLRDDPLFEITIPSKTQSYLAAGRPIVMAVRGDAAELVQRSGSGICCAPEDANSIVDAVLRLVSLPVGVRQQMGDSGREFYRKHLDLRGRVAEFECLLTSAESSGTYRAVV
jgi:colanic acid biosynthesis glycosyl transferase WcaI